MMVAKSKLSGPCRIILAIMAVGLLAACGKKGPPSPPGPPSEIIYPRAYPTY